MEKTYIFVRGVSVIERVTCACVRKISVSMCVACKIRSNRN